MNGITHKQALKWIDRRQDGLLKGNQQSLLEEHLHTCDSCRSYSENMEQLASRLAGEFQSRWQDDPGPSRSVVQNVTAKAKNIPTTKRFSYGFSLVSGVAVLVVLGIVLNFFVSQLRDSTPVANATQSVSSFPQTEERLLAFSSNQNGNYDIYTMHADGSGLTNLTNHPAYDGFPHWSPDGKQIAFESDRDGSNQIYLMDADGSNVTQLTQGGDANGLLGGSINTPWSPDGRKLIFSQHIINDDKHQFYVLDIATKNTILLTKEAGAYYSPSWSPDGEYIAFTSNITQGNQSVFFQLYIVDRQGTQLTNLTEELPEYESLSFADYYWSPDGTSITFVTESQRGTYKSTVYNASLDGSRVELAQTNQQILDWWNGIALQTDVPQKVEENSWSLLRADGSKTPIQTCQSNDLPLAYALKRSADGTLAFGTKCPPNGWMLYEVNPEGTTISNLLNSPLDARYDNLFEMSWSPDDHFLAFATYDEEQFGVTDLFILNAKDPSTQLLKMENSSNPSWQPVVNENLVKEEPTPQPTETISSDGLISFTAIDKTGNTDIFTVHPDGSGLLNLTNNPTLESNLAWSPDGARLAFVSDQNIHVMNADGNDLQSLTDAEGGYAGLLWSPNGTKIAYTIYDPEGKTANIYVMDSNGGNQRRLTDRHPGPDTVWVLPETWSPDGQSIYYSDYLAPGQSHIIKLNAVSGESTVITTKMWDRPSYIAVNQDGSKILYLAGCDQRAMDFCFQAKSVGQDGTNEETHETMQIQQACTANKAIYGISYLTAKWSPDRTKIIFAIECPYSGVQLYTANADGSDFKSVTEPDPFPYKDIRFNWSSDNQSIAFLDGPDPSKTGLSLWVIRDVVLNPDFQPTWLDLDPSQISELAWQPALSNKTVEIMPTPESVKTSSYDGLVAFTSAMQDGNLDIYTMRPDGSELVNLTSNPAHDINPVWSPDGKRIAFESDRDGNPHIYLMNADGSGMTQLTRSDGADRLGREISSVWSPDGSKLIFTGFNDQWDTYMVNADGSGLTRLPEVGQSPAMDIQARWSPDGRHVGFISSNTEALRIHVVDAESKSLETITDLLPEDEVLANSNYHWSPDGKSLYFTAYRQLEEGQFRWTAYEADLAAHRLIEKGTSSTPMEDWWDDTAFITGFGGGNTLTWLPPDGTYNTLNFTENCEIPASRNLAYGLLSKRSTSGNLLIAVTCPNKDLWFYWANPDGTAVKQLLSSPVNLSPNNSLNDIAWSTDDGYAAVLMSVNGITYMYILDVQEALQSPVSLSEPVAIGGGDIYYNISWQPVP